MHRVSCLAILILALTACSSTPPPKADPPKAAPTTASAPKAAPVSGPASAPASAPSSGPATTSRVEAATARLNASEAGKKVLRSINHHGGLKAWFDGGALKFRFEYRPEGGGTARNSLPTVDLWGSRVYHELAEPLKGTFAWDGQRAWSKFDPPGKFATRFWALTPYYFVAMPFVMGDPGVVLTIPDDKPADVGLPECDVVRATFQSGTGDAPNDYYVLYLAKDTGRLMALRYVVSWSPFVSGKGIAHTPEKIVIYKDPVSVGPLTLFGTENTHKMVEGKRGELVTISTVSEFQYKATFDPARLTMPEGAVIDESLGDK